MFAGYTECNEHGATQISVQHKMTTKIRHYIDWPIRKPITQILAV